MHRENRYTLFFMQIDRKNKAHCNVSRIYQQFNTQFNYMKAIFIEKVVCAKRNNEHTQKAVRA